ncbi:unnamed protein product [Anisakis simplex]|uniref:tRNA (guanine(46)-N(7))-methyltransferase n=1 Tax=Anisakis simplex TaxID=6269 RepID=A0A0M3K7N4_ANISI|nr:unnamed protein product [Anisakis simplex]
MSSSISIIGSAVLVMVIAGYYAQKYGLTHPPPPTIVGIDLGTTFSSIGIYESITSKTFIIRDEYSGKYSIPSVISFLSNGTILIGHRAVEQQERNPLRTIYDAKRFVGRVFREGDRDFVHDKKRYPFAIKLNANGTVYFEIPLDKGVVRWVLMNAIISVPAEFNQAQRNATQLAVQRAGMHVARIISEPTAAALAYGIHKKKGVEYIIVVDLGGGTLDVSVLWLQGGIFVTLAMAGNNRLGGQDFNDRIQKFLIKKIEKMKGSKLDNKEDVQQLRLAIETAKIQLTTFPSADINLNLDSVGRFNYRLTRKEFEELNSDLFESVVDPIEAALGDANIDIGAVDEIILVGGSTRIPRIRSIIGTFFGKAANHGIDPDLAVVTGASVQAGVIGGSWPLQVSDFVVDRIKALRAVANENEEQLIKYTNINCIRTNAMKYLPNYFCKSQLSKIFFLYPDPHFKKCKFKWRIISPMLIAEYAFVLRAGGMVYTLTDVKELSEWIVKHFNASKLFREIVIDDEAIRSDLIIELLLTDDPSEEGKKVSRTGGCKWLRCFERLHDDGT